MADSPFTTPKRKRTQLLEEDDGIQNLNTAFTFDPNCPVPDGSMSPRSRVAHTFRGLTLESGGGVTSGGSARTSSSPEPKSITDALHDAFSIMHNDMQDGARKRIRLPDVHMADTDSSDAPGPATTTTRAEPSAKKATALAPITTPTKSGDSNGVEKRQTPKSVQFAVDTAVVEQSETIANTGSAAHTKGWKSRSPLSSPNSSPRSRKRAGTPPLTLKTNPAAKELDSEEATVVDPLRASLTWHDDEITIYDPDDSDDDGTGINGIGFKPTPAIAYARTVRRRQQLAEYRKREEREARAKRNQRRRGSPVPGLVELKGSVERRRVRFMESATELIGF